MKKISRILCLLLSFVLVFCMFPASAVMAAEIEDTETTPTDPTQTPLDAVSEETLPTETVTDTEPTAEPSPEEIEAEAMQMLATDSGISTFATRATYENGKYSQRAIIWPTNGETVKYTYKGVEHEKKMIIMHTVWYNDAFQVAYCIEPGKSVITNSDYDESELGAGDAWGDLDFAKQRGVALTLLYGSPNTLNSSDRRTSLAYQVATYMIIHEIILGWRQDAHPFAQLNDAYLDVFGGGTESNPEYLEITSTWYEEVHGKYLRRADIQYAYNYISEKLSKHDLVPSFASGFQNQAPTHYMKDNGNGTYSVTLTDTNGILSSYNFTNTSDLTFSKSSDGKSVTITTSNKNLGNVLVAPTKTVPSPNNSAFLIWHAETDSQELCSLKTAKDDPVPAYFRLAMPSGNLSLTKTTEDGQNKGGWQFNIYSDQACTNKISGPHTTDASGKLTVNGLSAGTIWVKEIGNTDATVNNLYECDGTNPQKVTITAGQTATVTFNNRLRYGSITFRKATTTGAGVELGWTANLWKVESNGTWTFIGSGTTKQDKNDPTYTFADLLPGSYILQEAPESAKEGFALDTSYHNVTVTAGQNTAVTVTNTQLGRGKIIKSMPDGGSTEGWIFDVYRKSDNTFIGSYTTVGNSVITDYILPGEYLVYEQIEDDALYYCESPNPQTITVVAGQIAEVTFTNRLKPAQMQVRKTNTEDQPLSGVTLLLEWSEDGSSWQPVTYTDSKYVTKGTCTTAGLTDGKLTTDSTGILTFTGLHPEMQYRLTEVATADGYQLLADYAYEGGIPLDTLTVSLKIVNAPVFTLPSTGDNSLTLIPIGIMICAVIGMSALFFLRKKETA